MDDHKRIECEEAVRTLLRNCGENPDREGLLETPARYVRALQDWTAGYQKQPADVLKVFDDGAESYSEMVLVRDIPINSLCEHHMAPFWGKAHIAYIPSGKIVGLSKLARLARVFSQRLQVQERLTDQIAEALWTELDPIGCGVVMRCQHMCMESRGVNIHGSETVTSALRGTMLNNGEARSEFLSLVGNAMR